MDTETMIRELNAVAEKHKNDFVPTCQTNITAMCRDIIPKLEKLKEIEDLEEQGKLLRLPCAIGDAVYIIPSKVNYRLNILDGHKENNRVYRQIVENIVCTKNGYYMESSVDLEYGTGRIIVDKLYKETWFLTESEAKLALKEMEGENE